MTRWLESQGYDVSYYTSLDVSTNPLQLYSQKTFLSVGHDEYWSGEQRNNVEKARDNGTNLTFFSANTAYWQVRYEPSTSGNANRVMTVYKDNSYPAIGTGTSIDPVAQTNPTAATTLFRSPQVNRPENALLGVGYIGDNGSNNVYNGFDYVVSNASDPYYANTGLQNNDRLTGLVGYEWDAVLNNGFTPSGLVVLSQSPVQPDGLLPPLPPGTNTTIANSVRYTTTSGAKVFSTGSIQWVWGLDSDGVTNPRVDSRAQQIAVNVFSDMGARPQTLSSGIVTRNQTLTATAIATIKSTPTLSEKQVVTSTRVGANNVNTLGIRKTGLSTSVDPVVNISDTNSSILSNSSANKRVLSAKVFNANELAGSATNAQRKQIVKESLLENIDSTIEQPLTLGSSLLRSEDALLG
jgi:hypothetical protein